jgi:hypothetical protein
MSILKKQMKNTVYREEKITKIFIATRLRSLSFIAWYLGKETLILIMDLRSFVSNCVERWTSHLSPGNFPCFFTLPSSSVSETIVKLSKKIGPAHKLRLTLMLPLLSCYASIENLW